MMYLVPALTLRRREALRAEQLCLQAQRTSKEDLLDEFGDERFQSPEVQLWYDSQILGLYYNK
jgi:hypothetical protein